jgi:hypothetical protein
MPVRPLTALSAAQATSHEMMLTSFEDVKSPC